MKFSATIPNRRFWRPAGAAILCAILAGCASQPPSPTQGTAGFGLAPAQRTEVILTALGLLDTPYKFASAQAQHGFDCSGLVKYVYATATGTTLPHNTAQIAALGRPISKSALQAGDLVFFNTLGKPNSHMGIYMGDGQFINAPSTGGKVRIDSLDSPYYKKHYQSAATLFPR